MNKVNIIRISYNKECTTFKKFNKYCSYINQIKQNDKNPFICFLSPNPNTN